MLAAVRPSLERFPLHGREGNDPRFDVGQCRVNGVAPDQIAEAGRAKVNAASRRARSCSLTRTLSTEVVMPPSSLN